MSPAPSILRALIAKLQPRTDRPAPAAVAPDEAAEAARRVGRRDARLGGWYGADGALFPGCAIGPEDIVFAPGPGHREVAEFSAGRGARLLSAGTPAACAATRICSLDLLQQAEDPGRTLAELVRIGRPGAQYLLSVPDPVQDALQRRLAPEALFAPAAAGHDIRGVPAGDRHRIERDAFARMVGAAGLVVERRQGHGFFWAMYFAIFWNCEVDLSAPAHPALDNWVRTWDAVLDAPQGPRLKRLMDDFMPRSQVILARKP